MNRDDYAKIDAVNWSSLKHMRESPLVYRHRLANGTKDTPALKLGRVMHTLVFEPDKFASEYAIYEDGDRRGKAWAEFIEANQGKTIFKPKEIELAVSMANAVRRHPLVLPYLDSDGIFECALRWTDPESKLPCKAKLDWLLPKRRILADLKSTKSIEARRFGNDVARYAYYGQLGHYHNGVIHALDWVPERTLLIAVENEPPHDVAVFEVSHDDLYAGKEEVRELLDRLRECRTTNTWPGRYTTEQALTLPAWLFYDEEDADSFDLA